MIELHQTHREPRLEPRVVIKVICGPGELAEGDAVVLGGVVAAHRRLELRLICWHITPKMV